MTLTQAMNPRTWLPSLLLILSISAGGSAQEKTPQGQQTLALQVISKLDDFEQPSSGAALAKAQQDLQRLKSTIKKYDALASIELQRINDLHNKAKEQLNIAKATLDKLEEEALATNGTRIQSEETVEFLLRNCLLEQQRLALDSTTEKRMLEKSKKPNEDFAAEQLRIEAEEISLKGIMEKLNTAKKGFEAKQVNEQMVKDLENEIALRSTNLRAMMAEFQKKKTNITTMSEDRVLDIRLRLEMLEIQLERLGKQQQWARTAKQLNARIETAFKRIQEVEEHVLKSEMKKLELETLQKMIDQALQEKKE